MIAVIPPSAPFGGTRLTQGSNCSSDAGAPMKNRMAMTLSNMPQPAEEVGRHGQIGVAYKWCTTFQRCFPMAPSTEVRRLALSQAHCQTDNLI